MLVNYSKVRPSGRKVISWTVFVFPNYTAGPMDTHVRKTRSSQEKVMCTLLTQMVNVDGGVCPHLNHGLFLLFKELH